jgi:hypothetical protein
MAAFRSAKSVTFSALIEMRAENLGSFANLLTHTAVGTRFGDELGRGH